MIFKKKARLVLGAVLLLVLVLGLSLGSIYAREVDRIVTVKVAADEEYRQFYGPKYNWKYAAEKVVKKASRAFEEQFGISFEVTEFEEWDTIDEYSQLYYYPHFELMEEVKLENAEIVIGFTGQGMYGLGVANELLGRYVLILDNISSIPWIKKELYEKHKEFYQTKEGWEAWEDWCVKLVARFFCMDISINLVHELGHVFGADHTVELNSVMNVSCLNTTRFDEENHKIVLRNKYLDFKTVEALREEAQEAYVVALNSDSGQCADEEYKAVAGYWIKAAELYEKAGFSWSNAMRAAEAYRYAGFYLKATRQDKKAQGAYKKAGNLFLEVAKGYERKGIKEGMKGTVFDTGMIYIYKQAASCFELAGYKEKAEEVYRKYEELKEKVKQLVEEFKKV